MRVRIATIAAGVLILSALLSWLLQPLGFERATVLIEAWTLTAAVGLRQAIKNRLSAGEDLRDLIRLRLNGTRRTVLDASVITQTMFTGVLTLNLIAGLTSTFTSRNKYTLAVTLVCLVGGNAWMAVASERLAQKRHAMMERIHAGENDSNVIPETLTTDTGQTYTRDETYTKESE